MTKTTVNLLPIPDGNISEDSFDEEQDSDDSDYEAHNTNDLDDEVVEQESSEEVEQESNKEVDVDKNSDSDLDQKKIPKGKSKGAKQGNPNEKVLFCIDI